MDLSILGAASHSYFVGNCDLLSKKEKCLTVFLCVHVCRVGNFIVALAGVSRGFEFCRLGELTFWEKLARQGIG